MLGKLFKRTGATTVEDISKLSAQADGPVLRGLLSHVDPAIRAAAITQLNAAADAASLWRNDQDLAVKKAAEAVLASAFRDTPDETLQELHDWSAIDRLSVLRHCAPEQAERWLNQLTEAECLALAIDAPQAPDRLQAAEQLDTIESLRALQRSAKGHDKAVYKLAKTRLQNLRAVAEAQAAREAALEHVRQGLEKLANTTADPLLEGKLTHLMQRLEELQPTAEERALIEPLQSQVARRVAQDREHAKAQRHSMKQAEESRLADHSLIQQAEQQIRDQMRYYLSEGRLLPEEYGGWCEWLDRTLNEYRAAVASTQADPGLNDALKKTSRRYHEVLQALMEITLDWGNVAAARDAMDDDASAVSAVGKLVKGLTHDLTLWPDDIQALHRKWQAVQQGQTEKVEQEKKRVHAIRGLIRRGEGAVKGGHLRQARGIWRTIEENLAELPESGHDKLREQAGEFHAEMEKLADWQDFAVVPKKEELIAHMQALAERTMHPQDKADAVQALQKEWRKLSQGGGGKHQELWDKFHQLAEVAYAPCKDYFAEQDELHAVNFKKRQELIDQLHQYHATNDWHDPDWAEVEKVLRLAARDWRHFTPVKPKEHRMTEKAYHAAVQKIRDQLNQEYDRNKAERQRIIQAAEALRDEENVRTATERLKTLQQEWKQAGRTYRKDDQALWTAFRAICDELFSRRDEVNQAHKSELEQHLKAALAVIERIEQAAENDDTEALSDALQQLPAWEQEFEQCGQLPKARVEETRQRFRAAVDALKSARQKKRQSRERASWHALFERVKCLGELEAAMAAGEFDAELEKQVKAVWEDGTALPSMATTVDDRLRETLQSFDNGAPPKEPASADTARRQVVMLEVLTGSESPEEDKAIRMELQVQRLADGLGQQASADQVEQALKDWLASSIQLPVSDYLPLHDRVENAWMHYFFK